MGPGLHRVLMLMMVALLAGSCGDNLCQGFKLCEAGCRTICHSACTSVCHSCSLGCEEAKFGCKLCEAGCKQGSKCSTSPDGGLTGITPLGSLLAFLSLLAPAGGLWLWSRRYRDSGGPSPRS